MFGFPQKMLNRWAVAGKIDFIRSVGGHARYWVDALQQVAYGEDTRKVILYARVWTAGQKDERQSQSDYISKASPQCYVILVQAWALIIELMESVAIANTQ